MKEVKLWFARNENGEVVTIGESNKNEEYTCVLCGSKVIPKALESIQVQQHFAHLDVSKCTPEHAIHWWFKNKLIDVGDEITIKTNTLNTYICKSFDVEKECIVDGVTYKPDITIETEDGEIIYVEIANTNKKKFDEYIGVWSKLNNIVVELNIWNVINENTIGVLKAIYYKGLVFNDKKRKTSYQKSIGDRIDIIRQDDNRSEESIKRIKSLNWFWSDLCRYKFNKMKIEDLLLSIEEVKEQDLDIIENLFTKQSCLNILNDIANYKKDIIKKFIKEEIMDENFKIKYENGDDSLIIEYNDDVKNIYMNHYYKHNYDYINILYSEDELKNKALEFVNKIYNEIKKINFRNDITNKICELYNICDKNYQFEWYEGLSESHMNTGKYYGLDIKYNKNKLIKLIFPMDLFNDLNIEEAVFIIENTVGDYFNNIQPCIDEKVLYKTIETLDNIYKEIYITTDYNLYRFRLKIEQIEKDKFDVKLLGEDYLHSKYDWDISNKFDSILYSKNKIKDFAYNNENLYKLKYQLCNEFNKTILRLHKERKILKIWGKLPYKK